MRRSSKTTIEDVAREVGLSTATVSRALHLDKTTKVSEETRQRIREVARALDYQPNLAGRSLATGRANMVAYCTVDTFSYYYSRITYEIYVQASERDYDLIVNTPQHNVRPSGGIKPITAHCDGIIACDVNQSSQYFANLLQLKNTPLVGIGMYYPQDRDHVGFDLYTPSVAAMQHLLAQGCRRVLHVTGNSDGQDPRSMAYLSVLGEAALPSEMLLVSQLTRHESREGIKAFVNEQRALAKPLPDALFCINDEVALGCYRGLCDLGIRVPDDIMLVGCDGIEDTEYQVCPITTIALPMSQMCSTAWDFLENRIKNPQLPQQDILLQPQLIIRQSTQPVRL
ncbi:LacI family transcriptional regulator [bacterium]|nr:MAG: LacI family transcriptional regulator [bacterium]